jgi:hypothetical protein
LCGPDASVRWRRRRLHTLMQRVATIRNDKTKKRKEAMIKSKAALQKRLAKSNESLDEYRKTERKKRFRTEGKEQARRENKKQRTQGGGD